MSRFSRQALLSTSLVFIGGCSQSLSNIGGDSQTTPDIHVLNHSDVEIHYELTVRSTDPSAVILEDTKRLDPEETAENGGNAARYANPITKSGTYFLTISTSTEQDAAFRWDDVSEPAQNHGDDDGIVIHLYQDSPTVFEWDAGL